MNITRILSLVIVSLFRFPWDIFLLRLRKQRINQKVDLEDKGRFMVFRETERLSRPDNQPVVLVIGFRLKYIKSNIFMHWLFQHGCILTTPFWSGLKGFKIKLWMVNPNSKDYLGIYEWEAKSNADQYIEFLIPILKIFSIEHSIWHRSYPNIKINEFMQTKR